MTSVATALHEAVNDDDFYTLQTLLAEDARDGSGDLARNEWDWNEGAPLHMAANYGLDEMVRALINAGVDVNSVAIDASNGDRFTALHLAIYVDHVSTVRLLMELGANAMLQGNIGDCFGTAHDWVAILGNTECGDILKEYQVAAAAAGPRAPRVDLQSVIAQLKSRNDKEAILTKGTRIRADIERKETEVTTLTADIAALRAHEDFKTDEELKLLKEELEQIRELTEAFDRSGDDKLCPVCLVAPAGKVFACGNDEGECDGWFCSACKEAMKQCPKCRAEFNAVPPRRNLQLEKMLLQQRK